VKQATALACVHRVRLELEQLEDRRLLSGYDPAPVEQLFLEQLNDARANPAAYGASIGVDLSGVAPSQPLAFNTDLIEAARLHSIDMNARAYFSHYTPENIGPGQRMTAAGFAWTAWGESIAGGSAFPGPSDALRGLIIDAGVSDLGHRRHLLAIDPGFQTQNQVGIGIVQAGTGPLVDYYTIDTAAPAVNVTPYLTGVVIRDDNGNGKYDIGEGLGGVTITVSGVGSVQSFGSGGYSIGLAPGTYTVTASGGGLLSPITRQVVIGSSNVRLNFVTGYDSYVQRLYQTVLGRNGSTVEITAWTNYLQSGGSVAVIASIFEHSPEVQSHLVQRWYTSYLGRQPASIEVQAWVGAMQQGMSEAQVQSTILGSDEFYNRAAVSNSGSAASSAYAQALYSLLLGRAPSAAELANWVATMPSQTRTNVASAFVNSMEYRSDVVLTYYMNILHRQTSPSMTELSAWANSGMSLVDIRVGFETSPEFMHG
jgi:hypothetical protein